MSPALLQAAESLAGVGVEAAPERVAGVGGGAGEGCRRRRRLGDRGDRINRWVPFFLN
jgi:hypothetical protein